MPETSAMPQMALPLLEIPFETPLQSPFSKLYSPISLENFLHISDMSFHPPDFREALKSVLSEGMTQESLRGNAQINGTTYLSHILNGSGPSKGGEKAYANTRFPQITPLKLFGLARPGVFPGRRGIVEYEGRIALTFYDSNTGDLLLRNAKDRNQINKKMIQRSEFYLFNPNRTDVALDYLNGVIQDRKNSLLARGEQVNLNPNQLVLKLRSRLGLQLRQLSEVLQLTPIYLTVRPNREATSEDILREHSERTYN